MTPGGGTRRVVLDMTPLDSGHRVRGIGRYVSALAAALAAVPEDGRGGIEFASLVRDVPWGQGPAVESGLGFRGGRRPPPGAIGRRLRDLGWRVSLSRSLRRAGASLFHATDASRPPPSPSVPWVVTCYDLIPIVLAAEYGGRLGLVRARRERLARAWYGGARRIVAISEATRRDLSDVLGIDPARVDVVPCGVDHATFRPDPEPGEAVRVRAALGVRRPFLLYVGAADSRKNLPFLIRAFARSGVAREADLVLAGAMPGRVASALRAAAGDAGVAGAVVLPGFVPDELVPAAYRSCIAHVFPSRYEGFGLPVAEALACGAPTLAAMRTSVPEIASGAAADLPADDEGAAAEAIRAFVGDEGLRARCAAAGPARVRDLTWEASARGVLGAYLRALLPDGR